MRSRSTIVVATFITAVTFTLGCQASKAPATPATPVDHRAEDQAAILKNDSAWNKALATGDTTKAMSFYSTDAVLMAPGAPLAVGIPEIDKTWHTMMHTPGFALTFTPDKITVMGDMAYELGSYQMSSKDKRGKAHTENGKYLVVWARQADSSWKAVADAPTTTM